MDWNGSEWIGMVWNGLEWIGMDWNGLDWIGMDWIGSEWVGMARNELEWIGLDRNGYRDEAFITWNRFEDEFRILLTMTNSQFAQPIWNITDIGSTIHFRDILITNNNGLLRTSVYHEETFERIMSLSSFPDILQPAIKQDTWKWLRASFLKAIRYCSDPFQSIPIHSKPFRSIPI
ncbi:unnamed protein product, partial [Rotaria sp. Silwood1]